FDPDSLNVRVHARLTRAVHRLCVEPSRRVADDIVAEGHIRRTLPRAGPALVLAGLDHDRHAGLCVDPVVLEDVPFDEHAPGVLELEQVLHGPNALPRRILPDVVPANGDITRAQPRDPRVGAPEHDVLAGTGEEVVLDQIGPGAVPALDRL